MDDEYSSWQPLPNERGTWSILSSCIITLALCVYSAVHLNVPVASETRPQRWLHIAGWVLLGIFAPEVVVWTAWCQWAEAKQISKEMRRMKVQLDDFEKSSGSVDNGLSAIAPLINSWTLRHSYFVLMGGFQLRSPHIVHHISPYRKWYHKILRDHEQPPTVLSTHGFLALLRDGHGKKIPVLSEADIKDKSKADNLSKVLACLQGSWIFLQIFGRVVSHLAITELEINTLAHVICTIAMYVLWWKKPLKVEQPVFLENDGVDSWVTIRSGLLKRHRRWIQDYRLSLRSRLRSGELQNGLESDIHTHMEGQYPFDCGKCLGPVIHGIFLRRDVTMSTDQLLKKWQNIPGHPTCLFVAPFSERISGGIVCGKTGREKFEIRTRLPAGGNARRQCHWLNVNQPELEILLQAQSEFPQMWDPNWEPTTTLLGEPEFVTHPDMVKGKYLDDPTHVLVTITLSSLYGAIHASLWKHHFPSTTEMWMWRLSCVVVASSGVICIAVTSWALIDHLEYHHDIRKRKRKFKKQQPLATTRTKKSIKSRLPPPLAALWTWIGRLFYFVSVLGVALGLLCLTCTTVLGRLFLFIEAFISLRSQPRSVYQTPSWTQGLPHL